MSKEDCPAGSQWDHLVKGCVQSDLVDQVRSRTETATSEVLLVAKVQLRSSAGTPQMDPGLPLSPALWIFVVLATLGSILALALWLVIYRQQGSSSSSSEDSKPEQGPLQKTDGRPAISSLPSGSNSQSGAGDSSLCPFHLHLKAQSSSLWAEDIGPHGVSTNHAGTEKSREPSPCATVREHRIPLPATELGGTALVTTKTV